MFAYSKGWLLWGLNSLCGYTTEYVDGGSVFAFKCDDVFLNYSFQSRITCEATVHRFKEVNCVEAVQYPYALATIKSSKKCVTDNAAFDFSATIFFVAT